MRSRLTLLLLDRRGGCGGAADGVVVLVLRQNSLNSYSGAHPAMGATPPIREGQYTFPFCAPGFRAGFLQELRIDMEGLFHADNIAIRCSTFFVRDF